MIVGVLLPLGGFASMTYRKLTSDMDYKNFLQKESLDFDSKDLISYNDNIRSNDIVDPFLEDDLDISYDIKGEDKTFAFLRIDAIDLKIPVYLGSSDYNLSRGACHVAGSHLPIGGKSNRSILAGHRGWYGDILFLNLDYLKKGDRVIIDRPEESLIYEVYETDIIDRDAWDKVQPIEGEDILTLMTCDPIIPPYPTRLIVNCRRVYDKIDGEDNKKSDNSLGDSKENKQVNDDLMENKNIKQGSKDEEKVNLAVKKRYIFIYLLTFMLVLVLFGLLYKLLKYIRK